MGLYLHSEDAYHLYRSEVVKPYFIDKTPILEELIPLIEEGNNFVCLTRPRRFGKSVMASMIGAFFSNACDARELFKSLQIGKKQECFKHINQYDVIYIDFSEMDDACQSYDSYIKNIKDILREDLHETYKDVKFRQEGNISEDLKRVYNYTNRKIMFVFDEWDAIFHVPFVTDKDKESFLRFLKGLLKGKAYVSLAYMTGILPIAKYSSGSELNMFLEYTMVSEERFSEYFGFKESEVDELYKRYLHNVSEPKVSRNGLTLWYNGYHTAAGERLYNPRSVVASLTNNNLGNYWTSSGPYDEIFYYLKNNIADIQDDLAIMIAGEAVPVKVKEYAATSMNLQTKDEIFSAMVVYGFLSYQDGKVSIPNKELMDKFSDMLQKESSFGYIFRLAKESDRMLEATLLGDTTTMSSILQQAHDTETPIFYYNHEVELSAIVNLVYLSAREYYDIRREDKAGKGFVDFIFYPKKKNMDAIILELKVDVSPDDAIQQIIDKNYMQAFEGKIGEENLFSGRILLVGISYDKRTKTHQCKEKIIT